MNNLVFHPNEILLQPCEEVDFNMIDVSKYIEGMINLMKENSGLGLAAPQIGLNYRFFMMETDMYVNPIILEKSKDIVIDVEGCLSFPQLSMRVKRAKKVTVEYTDIEGNRKEGKFVNYMARCFQHELDHLDGITFDQRVSKLVFDRAIKKRRKQYGR
jgi:peptide deformylase|tara:strand:- start:891 stop:1364 length:474 start_codon:yes stop_codon:yes gene_type:complete